MDHVGIKVEDVPQSYGLRLGTRRTRGEHQRRGNAQQSRQHVFLPSFRIGLRWPAVPRVTAEYSTAHRSPRGLARDRSRHSSSTTVCRQKRFSVAHAPTLWNALVNPMEDAQQAQTFENTPLPLSLSVL